jgi:hypothetical protein
MKRMNLVLISVSCLFLGSCVTRGHNFSSDTSWIASNSTTRKDVKNRLGEPFSVGKSTNGLSWTYGFYKHSLFGQSRNKELKFLWNNDGTVQTYNFSSSFPEDKSLELAR